MKIDGSMKRTDVLNLFPYRVGDREISNHSMFVSKQIYDFEKNFDFAKPRYTDYYKKAIELDFVNFILDKQGFDDFYQVDSLSDKHFLFFRTYDNETITANFRNQEAALLFKMFCL